MHGLGIMAKVNGAVSALALCAVAQGAEAPPATGTGTASAPVEPPLVARTPARRLLTLEELAGTQIASSATLTKTEPRLVPAQVTVITREDIEHCGARNFTELLCIYVPGFQAQTGSADYVAGTRSLPSAMRYVMLVNGQKVNENWFFGLMPEACTPMLGDIESVEFVNGAGSVLYGAGAVGGVINIRTRSPSSLIPEGKTQGGSVRVSNGFVDRYSRAEVQYARKLSDGVSLGGLLRRRKIPRPHRCPDRFSLPLLYRKLWNAAGQAVGSQLYFPAVSEPRDAKNVAGVGRRRVQVRHPLHRQPLQHLFQ